jgi:hypothetical protein
MTRQITPATCTVRKNERDRTKYWSTRNIHQQWTSLQCLHE